jgi:hypothetical protein
MQKRPSISDEEFLNLWDKHKSPAAISKITGVAERNIHKRRRKLESEFKISLNANPKGVTHIEKARHIAGVTDGVVLVFSDAHFWPGIRTTAFKGLLWAIKELKPHVIVNNGDAFDGSAISRFPRIGWTHQPTVRQELQACQDALKEIEDACHKARHYTQLVWPLGNHDSRFETRLAEAIPQFEGVQGTALKDHFPKWKPCWSCWLTDEVVVKHRYKSGVHATHQNATGAGISIVTGHLHSLRVTPVTDYNGTRWGVDTGTLAEIDGPQFLDYLEDNPVNWRSGFAVLTFKNSKLLWPELVSKYEEDVIDFRGQLIDVSKY